MGKSFRIDVSCIKSIQEILRSAKTSFPELADVGNVSYAGRCPCGGTCAGECTSCTGGCSGSWTLG